MEALFQIGKDLGALEARVRSLETSDCDCHSKRRGTREADLPAEQRAILAEVKEKHDQLVAGFNKVLKQVKLADRVKIDGFQLVDVGVDREDDVDQCCMSCQLDGQSGWQYCCDYQGCSTCC